MSDTEVRLRKKKNERTTSAKPLAAHVAKRSSSQTWFLMRLRNLSRETNLEERWFSFIRCVGLVLLLVESSIGQAVLQSDRQSSSTDGQTNLRKITVGDCIRMVRYADPLYIGGGTPLHFASFSPDDRFFTIVVRRGDVLHNTNVYSLLLFVVADVVSRSSHHITLLSWAASSNRPAIKDVTWLSDNNTLLFLGAPDGRNTQLYSVERLSRKIRKLTDQSTDVTAYTSTANGKWIAFEAREPNVQYTTKRTLRDGLVVSTQLLSDIIEGQNGGSEGVAEAQNHSVFFGRSGSKHFLQIFPHGKMYSPPIGGLWLSPDARYCIVRSEINKVPATWEEYRDHYIAEAIRNGASGLLQGYEVINLRNGVSEPLLSSPVSVLGSELVWAPDSRSVIVSGTFLPLDVSNPSELVARESNAFSAEIDIRNRTIAKISAEPARVVKWESSANLLYFEERKGSEKDHSLKVFTYRKKGEEWELLPTINAKLRPITIFLSEDMNTAPRLMVREADTGAEVTLFDLNPQFREFAFGKVQKITWRDAVGREFVGGLYLPPDYIPGRRYPLIIQTHGFNPRRFWIDGPWTTAFAAQPLAAKEFAVLQVPDPDFSILGTPEEPARALTAFESSIDYLDNLGLIDRGRVGIIGFSRTCFYVKYALTHSKYRFAAAAVADGVDMGYWQYLALSNVDPSYGTQIERFYGAAPFGNGLQAWQHLSPGFQMDKVKTPLRIQAFHGIGLVWEWEWFAGLRRLRRPVDLVYLPNGVHVLEKPWDRLVSQEGNVEWFDFWLNGHEDPDPAKVEQYVRWRGLRKLQEENETKAAHAASVPH